MKRFEKYFTGFIGGCLKVLLSILLLGTIPVFIYFYNGIHIPTILVVVSYIVAIFVMYKTIKAHKMKLIYKIIIIMSIGIIGRVLWMININTLPYSDFDTMYKTAEKLVDGNNSGFTGNGYFARFPHLSLMIVYISLYMRIFKEALLAIKIGNLILSSISMYLIYKISLEIFNREKLALISLGISALFAPMITYVGVLATENVAIPFYLASVYAFILYSKNETEIRKIVLCGFLLGVGNLFRMVGTVMLIAYILYILIFMSLALKDKLKGAVSVAIPFFLVLFLVSGSLKLLNITEVDLWRGREPAITNVLKGTNFESWGMFNTEDSALPEKYNYDYEKVKKASEEIIKDRLTNSSPIKLIKLYIVKFVVQWGQGDMSGVSWSESGAEDIKFTMSGNAEIAFQPFYIIIITLTLISLFNKDRINKENSIINLFYLTLCGYGALYLITEMQGRYSYIVCWLFIIFATSGIETIIKYKNKEKIKGDSEISL